MKRFFNTTGPCNPADHYMLPAEERLPDVTTLIEQKQYFVVHAPRQSGKTTAMQALAGRLRGLGYAVVYTTLETCQGLTEASEAEPLWLNALASAGDQQLPLQQRAPDPKPYYQAPAGDRLGRFLTEWCEKVAVPMVLLLDEADVLSGPALVSFLRQLRAGFSRRGVGQFPTSIALIGMRDLRDYLTRAKDGRPVSPGSPFNVKSESLTLRNFTQAEVGALYAQHTEATGQIFEEAAVARSFYWTQGQPFLVNALARRIVMDLAKDGRPITEADIDNAKELLIRSRTTHLDSLNERLKEERVAKIMAPVLLGEPDFMVDLESDDMVYCVDLGLLRVGSRVEAANPIYQEVMARTLASSRQPNMPPYNWLINHKLNVPLLVDSFLDWWREHADVLRERDTTPYREAVPHIVFMAWIQKIVNGGGRITREYALGRGRVDVLVEFGGERHLFELKRVRPRDNAEKVKAQALTQAADYLEHLGMAEGWVLIFDERERSWDEKMWREEVTLHEKRLSVRGA